MGYRAQKELPVFATFNDLRAQTDRPSPDAVTFIWVQGGAAPNDTLQGIFFYDAASVAADDNATVIKSNWNTGTGRWIRFSPAQGGSQNGIVEKVNANYQVTAGDALAGALIEVDASGGPVIITYSLALFSGRPVTIAKVDNTNNPVVITTDGATPLDAIVAPANGSSVEIRRVWHNGVTLRSGS